MTNNTFAEKIISFCRELDFVGKLPPGIKIMNPFRNNPEVIPAIIQFYDRYYSDNNSRHMIIGINPGRFGAGVTGIPFTDTIRLKEKCGIEIPGLRSFETSSVFVYEMIDRYGGPEQFYNNFYITSVSPLGFTSTGKGGKELNYNYYDSKELIESIMGFAGESLWKQIGFGIERNVGFCLGTGKNFRFLSQLNNIHRFFDRIEPLEHPRYIMQYRSKSKESYIENYIKSLRSVKPGDFSSR
ncbi:MAG: DUF4918 family protein [Bacteroidales bacterium]|nr:DUF4918 family protein [Bacteroidales bacterium]